MNKPIKFVLTACSYLFFQSSLLAQNTPPQTNPCLEDANKFCKTEQSQVTKAPYKSSVVKCLIMHKNLTPVCNDLLVAFKQYAEEFMYPSIQQEPCKTAVKKICKYQDKLEIVLCVVDKFYQDKFSGVCKKFMEEKAVIWRAQRYATFKNILEKYKKDK